MKNTSRKNIQTAFTLAEVLIALIVIGVIAAITVPALMQNTQKQEYVSALKKTYSTLSQATQQIIAEEGSPKSSCETCNDGWAYSSDNAYDLYKKYLSRAKDCGSGKGCFGKNYKYMNGAAYPWHWEDNDGLRKMILSDGTSLFVQSMENNCNNDICAIFYVDVNGYKAPNIIGRDVFKFEVKENGLYPDGCSTGVCRADGWGCACKVLREGAMNY